MSEENPQHKSSIITALEQQERRQAEDYFTVYANNLAISFTTWDMALIFGEIVGLNPEGKPMIEEIGKVIMTREFAKLVAQILSLNIVAYEKKFGPIEMRHYAPPAITDSVDFDALSPSASPSPSKPPDD